MKEREGGGPSLLFSGQSEIVREEQGVRVQFAKKELLSHFINLN